MQAFSNEEVPRIHLPRPTDPATTQAEDAARRGVRIVIPGDDSAMPPPPPTSPSPSSSPRKKKKVNKRTVKAGTHRKAKKVGNNIVITDDYASATKTTVCSSRELPSTTLREHFEKPPFHLYGMSNLTPSIGGVVWGNYMLSHNVTSHTKHNKPPVKQIYAGAEAAALEPINVREQGEKGSMNFNPLEEESSQAAVRKKPPTPSRKDTAHLRVKKVVEKPKGDEPPPPEPEYVMPTGEPVPEELIPLAKKMAKSPEKRRDPSSYKFLAPAAISLIEPAGFRPSNVDPGMSNDIFGHYQ